MPGLSIIHCKLLISRAVRRSGPPAGMRGWCMCRAIAKALSISPKPGAPGGRNTGLARMTSSMRSSEPERLGSPSTYSAISPTIALLIAGLVRHSFMADVLVDVQVVLPGDRPGVILLHAVDHQLPELPRVVVPQPKGTRHGRLQGLMIDLVEDIPVSFLGWAG